MSIPNKLQASLASYDVSKLDKINDKDIIITEILNKGDEDDLNWLIHTYTRNDIKQNIKSPMKGMWLKNTLKYWLKIFDIKMTQKLFESSVLNLNA